MSERRLARLVVRGGSAGMVGALLLLAIWMVHDAAALGIADGVALRAAAYASWTLAAGLGAAVGSSRVAFLGALLALLDVALFTGLPGARDPEQAWASFHVTATAAALLLGINSGLPDGSVRSRYGTTRLLLLPLLPAAPVIFAQARWNGLLVAVSAPFLHVHSGGSPIFDVTAVCGLLALGAAGLRAGAERSWAAAALPGATLLALAGIIQSEVTDGARLFLAAAALLPVIAGLSDQRGRHAEGHGATASAVTGRAAS
ncbi:MAG: hypothetical protein HYV63_18935 [Candidatus Schekmanbacteria bacterium]|nr:hypothetical protein [Candidatus Schekmanbacteria bacterium]